MQSDYAWLAAVRDFPVKPAHQSADASFAFQDHLAWGTGVDCNMSPEQIEQHGSESESLTACGAAAAFGGNSATEVDSAARTAQVSSPLSPAAWPFVERKRPGTPVMHPVPRKFARKSAHPQRAREAVAEDWEEGSRVTPISRTHDTKPKKKAASDTSYRSSPPSVSAAASPAVSSEPKFNRHGAHICANCGTSKTPMWRRVAGLTYCNACGLRKMRSAVGGR